MKESGEVTITGLKIMEKAKLSLSIDCFPMQCSVWRLPYSIIDTVDRNPAEWNFAIDKNVSKRRTKIDYPFIKAYRVESELVTLGETEGEIDFHKVRIYDRDRTICDVLRNRNKMDREIFNKAVQGYVKDPKKNIPNLMEYAKVLRVQTKVKELIGVWL